MKKFCLAGVLGALLCASSLTVNAAPKADATQAPAKVPLVTRDNFVSLEFTNTDELGAYKSQFCIAGNQLRIEETTLKSTNSFFDSITFVGNATSDKVEIHDSLKEDTSSQQSIGVALSESDILLALNAPYSNASKSVGVSNHQIELLIGELNKIAFTKVSSPKGSVILADRRGDAVWLIINDEQGQDQIYTAAYNGRYFQPAPFKLINYLYYFQKTKFPDGSRLWSQQYVPFTRTYFQSLTLETSGGIEANRSTIIVRVVPKSNDLQLSQSINGKDFGQDQSLGSVGTWTFFRLLNSAKLPSLNGKSYKQLNLADGINEVLTLTLSDGRTFTFSNYGNHAPEEYAVFTRYLKDLSKRKN